MRGDVPDAFLDGEVLDLGSPLVGSSSLVVAILQATMSVLVTRMGTCGVLSSTPGVFVSHRRSRDEFFLPAKEFVGPLGSFVTR